MTLAAYTVHKAAMINNEYNTPDFDFDTFRLITHEAGKMAETSFAPIDVIGDHHGAILKENAVIASPGFSEAFKSYAQSGWVGLAFPEKFGGQELPMLYWGCAHEIWASANLALSLCGVLSGGVVEAILEHGDADQQAAYIPDLISGASAGTMMMTEPQAGSDLGRITSLAKKSPDGGYKLFGTKIFITWGDHDMAENIIHLVLARTENAPPGAKGLSLFIVPKWLDEDGARIRNDVYPIGLEHKLGLHGSPTCTMKLGENDGAKGFLVGEEGQGLKCMFTMMNSSRITTGLAGIAIAEKAYQTARDYAQTREQGRSSVDGKSVPLIHHIDIRRMLTRMKAKIVAARLLSYYTATIASSDTPQLQAREALLTPIVKAWGTDIGICAADDAIQVFGGAGYIEDTGISQLWRDVRVTAIYEGANGIQAIDLVLRKITSKDGQAMADLIADLKRMCDQIEDCSTNVCTSFLPRLVTAVDSLEKSTQTLRNKLNQGQLNDALSGARSYLNIFGTILGAVLMGYACSIEHDDVIDSAVFEEHLKLTKFFIESEVASIEAQMQTMIIDENLLLT